MTSDPADYDNHPMFFPDKYPLDTLARRQLSDTIHRWLWTGVTGGLVSGTSRVGKTIAARYLANVLHTRGKAQVPGVYVSMGPTDMGTIAAAYRTLCDQVGLATRGQTAVDLANSFVHHMADLATEAGSRRIVLFADEMQALNPRQFEAFAHIYNLLLEFDIALMVVFLGNDPECWELVEDIEQPNYAHIRGRFFTQGCRYLGLTSVEEVRYCLAQYDKLRYPESGPTYVGFFLPDAVASGWQIAALSRDIWRVFLPYKKQYHLDSWPMQYFASAITVLVTDFLPHYGVDAFDDDMMDECIRVSGLVPSLVRPAT